MTCTHCGQEVSAGSSVCLACGETVKFAAPAFTPVVTPGAAQSIPPPAGYTPPAAAYTAPPPPASSGSALKIILIVVAVFVFLGILAAAVVGIGVWRVSKSIVHKNANGDVSISTPGGTITSGGSSISESDLGVAIYPGATRASSSSMNIHTPSGSLISAAFLTPDTAQQVIDFYKGKIGNDVSDVSSMQSGNSTMLTSGGDSKNKVMVTVTPVGDGKTRVTILHTTKK